MAAEQFHSLVLGASGISGWSLLNQLCQYPTPQTWNRISGTTNRPFDLSKSGLPKDNRLQGYSGIDLTGNVERLVETFKDIFENVETVTHVFYTAYIAKDNRAELKETNTKMLESSITALNQIAPNLRAVILQTGGKGYGMEYKELTLTPPLSEEMPRIPPLYRDEVLYYSQYDTLARLSQSSKWTFAEIRPDGIIGFLPGSNPMNMGQGIALYLSVFRAFHGKGAEVVFPGSQKAYHTKHSDTFQDIFSKMEIHVAVKDKLRENGPAFNIADEDEPITWAYVWPGICWLFGLVGVGPCEMGQEESMEEFVKGNRASWSALCEEFSLRKESIDVQGWAHTHCMLVDYDFDRWCDLSRARSVGFAESIDTVKAYGIAFERMAAAGIIPAQYLESVLLNQHVDRKI